MDINELTPEQLEALGLRMKKTAFYESDYKVVDETTGEILRSETKQVSKVSGEPDFIKVYYKVMMAFCDVKQIPLEFLLAISDYVSYTNGGTAMSFSSNRLVRESICSRLMIKDGMYKCYLKRCCEQGILFPLSGYRGMYEVNPWLIAKGRWESIKKLQASFDFSDGRWKRIISDPPEEISLDPEAKLKESQDWRREQEARQLEEDIDG